MFPQFCEGCGEPLFEHNKLLCTYCEQDIPLAYYTDFKDNPLEEKFWGRTIIENATSLYLFEKSSAVQKMAHNLKYNGKTYIGLELGLRLGLEIKNSSRFNDVDIIMPVPIHWKRFIKRGYNQSYFIAKGLAQQLNKPIDTKSFVRAKKTKTQTKKNRVERWQNVNTVFSVIDPESIRNKHILLVDDIVTTGSTLEACVNTLLKAGNIKVSIAAIASV
ncbi:MAG: ComF family protein [Bacteroidales bacterium]|nr:ComF family protein [Bacteroidales bacterium]